jgi:hypothetical protein
VTGWGLTGNGVRDPASKRYPRQVYTNAAAIRDEKDYVFGRRQHIAKASFAAGQCRDSLASLSYRHSQPARGGLAGHVGLSHTQLMICGLSLILDLYNQGERHDER